MRWQARPMRAMRKHWRFSTTALTNKSSWPASIRSSAPGAETSHNDRYPGETAGGRPLLEHLGQRMAGTGLPLAARPDRDANRLRLEQERLHGFPGARRRGAVWSAHGARRADRAAPVARGHRDRLALRQAIRRCPARALVDHQTR